MAMNALEKCLMWASHANFLSKLTEHNEFTSNAKKLKIREAVSKKKKLKYLIAKVGKGQEPLPSAVKKSIIIINLSRN